MWVFGCLSLPVEPPEGFYDGRIAQTKQSSFRRVSEGLKRAPRGVPAIPAGGGVLLQAAQSAGSSRLCHMMEGEKEISLAGSAAAVFESS